MLHEKKNVETPKKKPVIIPVKNVIPIWNSAKVINLPINSKHIEYHGEIYLG